MNVWPIPCSLLVSETPCGKDLGVEQRTSLEQTIQFVVYFRSQMVSKSKVVGSGGYRICCWGGHNDW